MHVKKNVPVRAISFIPAHGGMELGRLPAELLAEVSEKKSWANADLAVLFSSLVFYSNLQHIMNCVHFHVSPNPYDVQRHTRNAIQVP